MRRLRFRFNESGGGKVRTTYRSGEFEARLDGAVDNGLQQSDDDALDKVDQFLVVIISFFLANMHIVFSKMPIQCEMATGNNQNIALDDN